MKRLCINYLICIIKFKVMLISNVYDRLEFIESERCQ